MSKIVIIIIVLLLLGAAGAYYYFYVMNKTPEEPTLAPTMGPTPPLDSFPYNIPGLSGRYTIESASESEWNDISGLGHHASVDRGTLKVTPTEVSGTPADGVKFPVEVLGTRDVYTLFYVAKYNGPQRKRIFDGINNNWLSSFLGGKVGVAHHRNWMTPSVSIHPGDEWLMGTDSIGLYRSNGRNRVTVDGNEHSTDQITINSGQHSTGDTPQTSDWAVKEIIFYNRKLSEPEIINVEKYLKKKYMSSGTENYRIHERGIEGFSF
jgi:hypothetical protein